MASGKEWAGHRSYVGALAEKMAQSMGDHCKPLQWRLEDPADAVLMSTAVGATHQGSVRPASLDYGASWVNLHRPRLREGSGSRPDGLSSDFRPPSEC